MHQTQAFILGRLFITGRLLFLDVGRPLVDMVFACSIYGANCTVFRFLSYNKVILTDFSVLTTCL